MLIRILYLLLYYFILHLKIYVARLVVISRYYEYIKCNLVVLKLLAFLSYMIFQVLKRELLDLTLSEVISSFLKIKSSREH